MFIRIDIYYYYNKFIIVTVVAVMLIYKETKMSRMFLKSHSHLPKKYALFASSKAL